VDINADHLAMSDIDSSGNLVRTLPIDLSTYGKSRQQAEALIGDVCVAIAEFARAGGKPVVHELLDFARKKAELEATGARYARMLSSLSYSRIITSIDIACFRHGVETIAVNPAYTSVIGAVNHTKRHGISVHMGAACAIARRGLGLSERPAVRSGHVPARGSGHVTFALPVRNHAKHVWSLWAGVRRSLKAAPESGACSACPVGQGTGQGPLPFRTIGPGNAVSGCSAGSNWAASARISVLRRRCQRSRRLH
jgi:IS605 OrfB family transposase